MNFVLSCFAAKRYCLMLFQEEGDEILVSIIRNSNVTSAVSQCCISILELLRLEGLTRDPKWPAMRPCAHVYFLSFVGNIHSSFASQNRWIVRNGSDWFLHSSIFKPSVPADILNNNQLSYLRILTHVTCHLMDVLQSLIHLYSIFIQVDCTGCWCCIKFLLWEISDTVHRNLFSWYNTNLLFSSYKSSLKIPDCIIHYTDCRIVHPCHYIY